MPDFFTLFNNVESVIVKHPASNFSDVMKTLLDVNEIPPERMRLSYCDRKDPDVVVPLVKKVTLELVKNATIQGSCWRVEIFGARKKQSIKAAHTFMRYYVQFKDNAPFKDSCLDSLDLHVDLDPVSREDIWGPPGNVKGGYLDFHPDDDEGTDDEMHELWVKKVEADRRKKLAAQKRKLAKK